MASLKKSSQKELPRLMGMPFAPGVALLYLLLAGLWIYYSDLAAKTLASNEEQLRIFSTYKGWGFVVLTAALLFFVLNRFVFRIRLAQQCLREHDENLRITLNSIGDAVISTGMDGTIVSLNPVAEALTGWSREDAAGQPLEAVFKIINEQTRKPAENPVTKVLEAGTVVGLANHTLLLARDGREIPIADSGAPIKNESGKITGVVLVFRDQTEEKATQTALRENEESLRKSQVIAGLGSYVLNISTGLWKSSDTMNKVFGIDEAYVRSIDGWTELVHPDDRAMMTDYFKNEVLGRGRTFNKEYRIVRHNDRVERWVHGLGELEFDAQGRPLKMHGTIQDITERKQTEAELKRLLAEAEQARRIAFNVTEDAVRAKEQLELTQFALDHSADSVFWIESDATFAYVNESACKTLGYTREELLRLSALDVDPYLTESIWTTYWQEMKTKEVIRFEARHKTKGGKVYPVEIHASFIQHGDRQYFCAFAHDITERRQAATALRESEMQLRVTLDSTADGILAVDNKGKAIQANQRFIELWRIPQSIMERRDDQALLDFVLNQLINPAAFLSKVRSLYDSDAEDLDTLAFKDGRVFERYSAPMIMNGIRTGRVWSFRDITERKQAEAELRRLSTAINQTVEAVAVTDAQGILQYVNPAFEKITGYSSAEAIGKNPRVLKSGKHDEAFYRNLWQTISSGLTWTERLINKRKDGTLYTEEAAISPVFGADGTIINYVAVKRDITEELKKEEEYRQAQKMEAVGQLAGGIAHDFNNILQAILGFSEILMSKMTEETQEYQNVSEIRKAAVRAADITRQLLIFSHKQPAGKTRLDINTVIRDTEVLLQLLLGEKISRVLNLANDLNPVEADYGQISQIIINMAINGRDAMPEGGHLTISTGNIRLSPADTSVIPESRPGDFICLAVIDTGFGMSREVKDHLFEPFFTTKKPGKGTGLGLAGIYGIVKQHKGWINVYSEEGTGTTFKVYLPVIGKTGAPAVQPGAEKTTPDVRILLVENDPTERNSAIRLLQDAGYQVSATESAKEACVQFDHEQADFDLLFSNIVLPDKTGIELADRLRKTKPGLPVLLSSGYHGQREKWKNIDSKGYHFLQKPFTATALLAAVYDILAEAKKYKE